MKSYIVDSVNRVLLLCNYNSLDYYLKLRDQVNQVRNSTLHRKKNEHCASASTTRQIPRPCRLQDCLRSKFLHAYKRVGLRWGAHSLVSFRKVTLDNRLQLSHFFQSWVPQYIVKVTWNISEPGAVIPVTCASLGLVSSVDRSRTPMLYPI